MDHLWHLDVEEYLTVVYTMSVAGLALALGSRHEGTAEGLQEINAEDEAESADTGYEGIQVDAIVVAEPRDGLAQ